MQSAALYESPFTDVSPRGPEGVFSSSEVDRIIAVLEEIREPLRRDQEISPNSRRAFVLLMAYSPEGLLLKPSTGCDGILKKYSSAKASKYVFLVSRHFGFLKCAYFCGYSIPNLSHNAATSRMSCSPGL